MAEWVDLGITDAYTRRTARPGSIGWPLVFLKSVGRRQDCGAFDVTIFHVVSQGIDDQRAWNWHPGHGSASTANLGVPRVAATQHARQGCPQWPSEIQVIDAAFGKSWTHLGQFQGWRVPSRRQSRSTKTTGHSARVVRRQNNPYHSVIPPCCALRVGGRCAVHCDTRRPPAWMTDAGLNPSAQSFAQSTDESGRPQSQRGPLRNRCCAVLVPSISPSAQRYCDVPPMLQAGQAGSRHSGKESAPYRDSWRMPSSLLVPLLWRNACSHEQRAAGLTTSSSHPGWTTCGSRCSPSTCNQHLPGAWRPAETLDLIPHAHRTGGAAAGHVAGCFDCRPIARLQSPPSCTGCSGPAVRPRAKVFEFLVSWW